MTAVGFEESVRYAGRLFSYLVGVTVLGAIGVILGLGLGWPGILDWERLASLLGSTDGGLAYSIGGAVLIVLGGSIVAVGYISAAYKLLADGVAAGAPEPASPTAETARDVPEAAGATEPVDPSTATGDGETATEPSAVGTGEGNGPTGPAPIAEDASEPSSPSAAVEPAENPEPATEDAPPEPSPEEIAFGQSESDEEPGDDDAGVEAELDEEEPVGEAVAEEPTGGDVRPAASDAPSDPLADPTDDG